MVCVGFFVLFWILLFAWDLSDCLIGLDFGRRFVLVF